MNNKSDKKHKRSQKKPRTKKKTASHQSKKKKEIKGGELSFSSIRSFFSKESKSRNSNQTISQNPQLANPNNSNQTISQNPQLANPNNSNQTVSQNPQPNAKPQGFNTLKAQSRCSIL